MYIFKSDPIGIIADHAACHAKPLCLVRLHRIAILQVDGSLDALVQRLIVGVHDLRKKTWYLLWYPTCMAFCWI